MPPRPVPHPPRMPSIVKLALLLFALAASLVWSASILSRCTQSKGAIQVPDPFIWTETQRLLAIVEHLRVLGSELPPQSPDQQVNARRALYQQMLCQLAHSLHLTQDPAGPFRAVVESSCAAQWEQWPEQAQGCFPCQN